VPALSWLVCSASARGRAHRDDVPNQDAVASTEVEGIQEKLGAAVCAHYVAYGRPLV
jgi:hypothetical protein